MTIELSRKSIDVGLVVEDIDRALAFYGEILELELAGTMPMPDGGTMYRMVCGDATIKLIVPPAAAAAAPAPGGAISAARGWRYVTIWAVEVEAIVARCRAAGCRIEVEPREFRPGVVVGIVEDLEGNLVELVGERPRA
jgi:catechol 2,3-dioxygenase-like lactoylglutathione lyase family enzyme